MPTSFLPVADEPSIDAPLDGFKQVDLGPDSPARPSLAEAPTRKFTALRILCVVSPGIILSVIDQSIVDVSLVTIADEMGKSIEETQWVILIYYLVSASTLSFWGRFGDRYDKTSTFLVGMMVFVASSVGCGMLSWNLEHLICWRALQALGGTAMTANGMALIVAFTEGRERALAVGYNSTVVGLALTAGPPIGGTLTQFFGWQSIFLVQVPLGSLALVFAWFTVPRTQHHPDVSLDPVGALLLFFSIGLILFAASVSSSVHAKMLWVMAGVAIALFGALVAWHLFAAAPLIPPSVFRKRGVVVGVCSAFGLYFSVSLCRFVLPFYLQESMGFTQSQAGMALMVQPICMGITGLFSGRAGKVISLRTQTMIGIGVFTLATVMLSLTYGNLVLMLTAIAFMAFGQIFFSTANQQDMLDCVTENEVGICSALNSMARATSLPLGTVSAVAMMQQLNNMGETDKDSAKITTLLYLVPLILAMIVSWHRSTVVRVELRDGTRTRQGSGGSDSDAHSCLEGNPVPLIVVPAEQCSEKPDLAFDEQCGHVRLAMEDPADVDPDLDPDGSVACQLHEQQSETRHRP
eukprot:TRINITY_DN50127_c0_g2_i1.p1 TRINITY_DN50127_c0_g2~~TRINITY_DN50127_c0_g2_i1.p1  ORF type:complete len:579 (+),score=57.86 TRINITY_DN50127_c0_g2_i1:269-2005(+)